VAVWLSSFWSGQGWRIGGWWRAGEVGQPRVGRCPRSRRLQAESWLSSPRRGLRGRSQAREALPAKGGIRSTMRRVWRPNNSLQLTRLACGKLDGPLPARLRENEWGVARAAGQLSSRPLGGQSHCGLDTSGGRVLIRYIKDTSLLVLVLPVIAGCARATSPLAASPPAALPASTPQLRTAYLGQEPPGMIPEVFAPGIVSLPDFNEYSGAFSPDGSEYYFYRFSDNTQAQLLFSETIDGGWSTPEALPFTDGYGAFEPHLTLDNERLYFMWLHPLPPGEPDLPGYFFVERTQDGWSEPEYAGQGMFLSSSRDGQLYTTDMSSRNADGRTYLVRLGTVDGRFTEYERLPIEPPRGNPAHPCIAPDGSYLLFDVESGNYLYVSFRNEDGDWGEPIDLTEHGLDPRAGGAYVSPDGRYLFFSLDQDIWWVDIAFIELLHPSAQGE